MMRDRIYFDEKLERKRRKILKIKIYLGLAVFIILFFGAGYLTVYSSLFKIKEIHIDSKQTDGNEIIKNFKKFLTEQSKLAEFLGVENILIWKSEKIGEFLKTYPQLEELKIEKKYFDKEVRISVFERERFGIWCSYSQDGIDGSQAGADNSQKSVSCLWFDRKGVAFSEALKAEGQLITKISDFSGRFLVPGDFVLEERFFPNLVKIFEILEKSNFKIKSLKLENIDFQEVVAESLSAPKIYFSLRIDPEFALVALESMEKIGLKNLEYIDLRVENRVYYKLK